MRARGPYKQPRACGHRQISCRTRHQHRPAACRRSRPEGFAGECLVESAGMRTMPPAPLSNRSAGRRARRPKWRDCCAAVKLSLSRCISSAFEGSDIVRGGWRQACLHLARSWAVCYGIQVSCVSFETHLQTSLKTCLHWLRRELILIFNPSAPG